jgi:hypothetical protein
MSVFGTRPFGKCDVVPELFYVSTWFFHINFFPLIPMGTRLVLGRSGNSYRVVHIPLSFKSLLLAWITAASFFACLISWIITIVMMSDRHGEPAIPLVFSILATIVAGLLAFLPRRASYERACQLAELVGLNERGWAALNVQYGRAPNDRPNTAPNFRSR